MATTETAPAEPFDPVTRVDYLVGHAPDNDGQNPFGQDHVMDLLEEMHPAAVRAVAMEAICRLANRQSLANVETAAGDESRFVVTPTKPAMHIIRRADGSEVNDDYGFVSCTGPDDWQTAEDNEHELYDEEVEYQILAAWVVATRTFGVVEVDDDEAVPA